MVGHKVAIVTGASRGIGKVISLALAKDGYCVALAAKSVKQTLILPGTINITEDEIKKNGGEATSIETDVTKDSDLYNLVEKTKQKYGRIDVLVNNAGALYWDSIVNTPPNKYDLINNVNARASFVLSHFCLPQMEIQKYGHIIMHSPPIQLDLLKNHTGYLISKYGMTMTALGIAQEYTDTNITANTIWPATMIESFAVINHNLGDRKDWRKPEIISDCILKILREDPKTFRGNTLIDEIYLKSKGIADLSKYQCVPGMEPDKITNLFKKK